MIKFNERVKKLKEKGIFLGGPPELFEIGGRKQLITLLNEGLNPSSKVLDIGCGCLRGGYWLIHFLDTACYFGIEPNRNMLDAGVKIILEPELTAFKKPRFDYNSEFNFSVFGTNFDFFVARSIWTHASKNQIRKMLDGFVHYSKEEGAFITSYIKPSLLRGDYKENRWIGRSHKSDTPGMVRHKLSWIQKESNVRGLCAKEIEGKEYNFGGQKWLKIIRKST
ncbi:MAG: class I SAM-dependent methyltransferase [Planctomycetota bacterium]|jgi:hypothetical protein